MNPKIENTFFQRVTFELGDGYRTITNFQNGKIVFFQVNSPNGTILECNTNTLISIKKVKNGIEEILHYANELKEQE